MKKIRQINHTTVLNLIGFILLISFVSCKKCKECKECETNPVTGKFDLNCGPYVEYCGSEAKEVERYNNFNCK